MVPLEQGLPGLPDVGLDFPIFQSSLIFPWFFLIFLAKYAFFKGLEALKMHISKLKCVLWCLSVVVSFPFMLCSLRMSNVDRKSTLRMMLGWLAVCLLVCDFSWELVCKDDFARSVTSVVAS